MSAVNKNKIKRAVTAVAVAAAWLLIWLVFSVTAKKTGLGILLPTPFSTVLALKELLNTKAFYISCGMSLLRVLVGWLSGLCVGTLLAVVTAKSKLLNAFFSPALHIVKATPVASFIVAALVLMSSGRVPVFTGFLMSLPVVWANVSEGILSPDKKLLIMAAAFGMSKKNKLKYIYIPSVKPYFSSAATTAMGLTWKAGIAAEVICNPKGSIGAGIYNAKIYLETPSLFAWTITVIVLSVILEKLIKLILLDKENVK